jgi:hypothetical protein
MKTYPTRLTAAEILTVLETGIDIIPVSINDIRLPKNPNEDEVKMYNLVVQKQLMRNNYDDAEIFICKPFEIDRLDILDKYTLEQVLWNILGSELRAHIEFRYVFSGKVPTIPFSELDEKIQKKIKALKGFDNFCMENPSFQEWVGVERVFAPSTPICNFKIETSIEGYIVLKLNFSGSYVKMYTKGKTSFICQNYEEALQIGKFWVDAYTNIHLAKQRLTYEANHITENMLFVGEPYIKFSYSRHDEKVIFQDNSHDYLRRISEISLSGEVVNMVYTKGFRVATKGNWIEQLPCFNTALDRLAIPYAVVSDDIWLLTETLEYAEELLNLAIETSKEIRKNELLEAEIFAVELLTKRFDFNKHDINKLTFKIEEQENVSKNIGLGYFISYTLNGEVFIFGSKCRNYPSAKEAIEYEMTLIDWDFIINNSMKIENGEFLL